jgi:hypothetical protein
MLACHGKDARLGLSTSKVHWNCCVPSGQAEVASLNQKAEDMAGQMDEKLAVVADAMHHLFNARVLTMD